MNSVKNNAEQDAVHECRLAIKNPITEQIKYNANIMKLMVAPNTISQIAENISD